MSRSARSLLLIGYTWAGLMGPTGSALGQEPQGPDPRIGVLLAVGDFMSCDGASRLHARDNVTTMVREISAAREKGLPVAILMLGDLAYDHGSKRDFECFEEEVVVELSKALPDPRTALMPVPGNHDMETNFGKWFYVAFRDNRWVGDGRPGDDKGYYSAAFPDGMAGGAWRLLGINSQIDTNAGSRQYRWLKRTLDGITERCILAFWHMPVFSSGYHGHDESEDYQRAKPVKQGKLSPIFDLLYAARSSLILNGHDHNFEHLAPHNSAGKAVDGGLRAFIVGTGGMQLRREYKEKLDLKVDFDAKNYGFLKIDLYPDRYDWHFLKAGTSSNPLHAGSGTCNTR